MPCFICGNSQLINFLDLGHQPPSDAFLHKENLLKPEINYPLSLDFCETCKLVQLGYVVEPSVLFQDYVYTSGTNNSLRKNFKELVDTIVSRFGIKKGDLAVDIGSNDGTLLRNYMVYGISVLGIDPSSVALQAQKDGIPSIVDFFNETIATKAAAHYGRARIITATNVFAHVADLHSFMRGIEELLAPEGIFVSESHYLLDIIEKLQYDSVYHEHLRYYSIRSLMDLFNRFNLEIFDVERISTHNGSIRVFAARKGNYKISDRVKDLLAEEEDKGINDLAVLQKFSQKVVNHRRTLQTMLLNLKQNGATIAGIGAPAKGNTLLNYCRLDGDVVNYLVEKSDLKIGTFAPGTHIPVVGEERLFREQPEYALILSWNITDELVSKLRQLGYRGKFIVPFPEPRIIAE